MARRLTGTAGGRAYPLEPPVKVRGLKAKFPQGIYTLEVEPSAAWPDPRDWYFVVADHACLEWDILSFPHEPKPAQVAQQ